MKQKEILLSIPPKNLNGQTLKIDHSNDHCDCHDEDDFGDAHLLTSLDTPLREDAFAISDEDKIAKITEHFKEIMNILGLDLQDDSLKGTPKRVAKMYVKEIFSGLNPANKPAVTLFDNKYRYNEMLVEKDITFHSCCEHHFVPIYGKVHVAYVSSGQVIGLSKINRIVQYFAKRPQVQERMTVQIGNELKKALKTDSVAVIVDAFHMCVSTRGVQDVNSSTITSFYSGIFEEENKRNELLQYLSLSAGKG
ncbi:MAG: GTP cyclohydrolase I FolE [Cytophagales bacterium]|nr:MAG: GTP cyclohydrolase I FolE [Cytophagales bacterium]